MSSRSQNHSYDRRFNFKYSLSNCLVTCGILYVVFVEVCAGILNLRKIKESPLILYTRGCWKKCGGGGRCPKVCGKDGFCCRQGYKDCPANIARFNPYKQHACINFAHILAGPALIPNSGGCWRKCRGGGSCPKTCGENGYCCRQGYKDCPARIAKFNPNPRHACISVPKVLPGPSLIANSGGCWRKCGGGGSCPKVCGENGFCCSQGYQDCPARIKKFNPSRRHACISVPDVRPEEKKKYQQGKKESCEQGKTEKCKQGDNKDYASGCPLWAAAGECEESNSHWMKKNCGCSCKTITTVDNKAYLLQCPRWAATGECERNSYAKWMKKNCGCSCKTITRVPKKNLKLNQQYCGLQLNRWSKVGGVDAKFGEWPWQIGIVKRTAESMVTCGGTLISSRAVLTAAHCFPESMTPDASKYAVRLGDLNLDEGEGGEEVANVVKIIKHQKYERYSYDNDVAVMILEHDVGHKSYVGAACVAINTTPLAIGQECFITGWGMLKEGGKSSRVLQKAMVPIVPRDVCNKAYKKYGPNSIKEGMFCAGYKKGGIDACKGDSGGPLVCKSSKGKYFLHGIISWGAGCARTDYYGVYAKVAHYTAWIDTALKS